MLLLSLLLLPLRLLTLLLLLHRLLTLLLLLHRLLILLLPHRLLLLLTLQLLLPSNSAPAVKKPTLRSAFFISTSGKTLGFSNLHPIKAFLLTCDKHLGIMGTQRIAQCFSCKLRQVVLLAQMSADHPLQPGFIQCSQNLGSRPIGEMPVIAAYSLLE
ncbi:MAG: hypothetical protein K0S28_1127 [Paucimonas sp.]|nr:hypothetical protein [Paucimonas sp.]